ncbi:branched-chain amino acid ABC transporter permease [Enterococcus sp. LJL98]
MEMIIQQLINGLFLGSIYALMALGYTMVYGIIKLINFAHGEIYMIGSFIGYFFIHQFNDLGIFPGGWGFFISMLISMVVSAALGVMIEIFAYRPLRGATRISALITAIGVSYLLQNLMIYFFTPDTRPFPQAIERQLYTLGGISVSNIQLLILGVSVSLMLLLQLIVKGTKMGKAMRAVSVDPDAAQLMGINVNRTISFTFALGSALAAAGGMLIGLYYNSIDPMMGVAPGLKSFVAAVLGGIGIIPGAALGGFVIGLIETLSTALGFSDYKDALVYGVLIVILIIRPAGILGKNVKEKV